MEFFVIVITNCYLLLKPPKSKSKKGAKLKSKSKSKSAVVDVLSTEEMSKEQVAHAKHTAST